MLKRLFSSPPAADLAVGERAGEWFDRGLNCAQAVLCAHCGELDPQLMAIGKSFGGGIAGAKCLCGAVSGGVMALSIKGKGTQSDKLVAAFRKKHRMTCCSGLSKSYRWKSPEHRANCRMLTVSAAELVEKILCGEDPLAEKD